jgi:hypothetical protein
MAATILIMAWLSRDLAPNPPTEMNLISLNI